MAFPAVESVTETSFATATTAHLVAMPATVVSGNLLHVKFAVDSNVTVTTPTGWTLLHSTANGTSVRFAEYYRIADGTEGGTTVDFVTSAAEAGAAQTYRISGWHGTTPPEVSTPVTGSSNSPDPGALTPSWGAADTLWLAGAGWEVDRTVTAYPTNYTDGVDTISGAGASGAGVGSARRSLNAASEDSGAFTLSAAPAWVATLIAIRPTADTPTAITASDTLTVSAVATTAVTAGFTAADTATVGLTDTQTSLLSSTAADTATVSLTETAASFLTSTVTDTLTVGIGDAAAVTALLAVADTLSLSITDTAALLISEAKAVADTLTVSLTDTVSLQAFLTVIDTLTVGLTETQTSLILTAVTDLLTVGLTDIQTSLLLAAVSDLLTVALVDTQTSSGMLAAADTITVSITDTGVVVTSESLSARRHEGRLTGVGQTGHIQSTGQSGRLQRGNRQEGHIV